MLFKKSQTIPFEILKILRLSPTHGYNIFLNLKRQGLVKDPSELYKIAPINGTRKLYRRRRAKSLSMVLNARSIHSHPQDLENFIPPLLIRQNYFLIC